MQNVKNKLYPLIIKLNSLVMRHPLRATMLLVTIGYIIYLAPFWQSFLQAEIIPGWDGHFHFVAADYYSQNIYPNLTGWIPNWSVGMPWPVGYPPLTTYLTALGSHLTGISTLTVFKLIFLAIQCCLPALFILLVSRLLPTKVTKMSLLICALIFIAFLSSDLGKVGGIVISATFTVGLYPNLLGFACFLMWWTIFSGNQPMTRRLILLSITWALIILSNLHIATYVAVFIVINVALAVYRNRWTEIATTLSSVVVGTLISAFWWLPFSTVSDYFLTRTLQNVTLGSYFSNNLVISVALAISLIVGTGVALWTKNRKIFAIGATTIILLIVSLLPIYELLPGLPLQPIRIQSLVFALCVVMAAYLVSLTIRSVKVTPVMQSLVIMMILFYIAIVLPQPQVYFQYNQPNLNSDEKELVSFMSNLRDGRSLVEFVSSWEDWHLQEAKQEVVKLPVHLNLYAELARNGNNTIWSVFRESSFNMPFIQAVRNTFSEYEESWGAICYLCTDIYNKNPGLALQFKYGADVDDLSIQIRRARELGIKYIVSYSETIQLRMAKTAKLDKQVKLLKQVGNWHVYQIADEIKDIRSTPNTVLTYTQIKNRDRLEMDYDWLRLNEEWLYFEMYNTPLALAKDPYLDSTADLDKFPTAFIVDYKYRDYDQAFRKISQYAESHPIYLLQSNDKLFINLAAERIKGNQNINIVNRTGDVRESMEGLRYLLNTTLKTTTDQIDFAGSTLASIKISNSTSSLNHVSIKSSYFPWWKDAKGGEVYLSSPGFIQVVTSQPEIELRFDAGQILPIAQIVSISGLVSLIVVWVSARTNLLAKAKLVASKRILKS